MFFMLAFLLVGGVAALFRGGSLRCLEGCAIRGLWEPIAAFALQGAEGFIAPRLPGLPMWVAQGVVLVQYGLLLHFALANVRLTKAMGLAALGTLFNLLVIAANGFRMPVSQQILALPAYEALAAALAQGAVPRYMLAGEETKLLFLADIIHVHWVIEWGFASIGDIVMGLGLGWVFYDALKGKLSNTTAGGTYGRNSNAL